MVDKIVGWLVPASAITPNMTKFQNQLRHHYQPHGNVSFPDPQFLQGDNSNLPGCVQALITHNPPFDALAVAGSTGVRYLWQSQFWMVSKIPIVQVVGGDAVPDPTFITGYHLNAATIADEQVRMLRSKRPRINQLTILFDASSDTAPPAFNAAQSAAVSLGIQVNPLPADNPAVLRAWTQGPNPVVGSFMLAPSGMFYNSDNMSYIIRLVEAAGVPAIYPEREYKVKHSPGYSAWVHGHKVPETYVRAAKLANDVLLGNLQQGGEAPDRDSD
jgi:hypothetical protein